MAECPLSKIIERLGDAGGWYHRLILVVAPASAGKTKVLQGLGGQLGCQVINVNLELSRQLLELSGRRRVLKVPRILEQIVADAETETEHGRLVLLDNVEILFDTALKLDPLRLLQGLSRNRTVVSSWNGTCIEGSLVYAESGHPEFQRYVAKELVVVNLEDSTVAESHT